MFDKNNKKHLAFYSLLSLLFTYPLIQAGIFYRDDLDRAITGQYGWRSLGRPVAELLMQVLSASGKDNLDLYPYTMLAACFFIGLSTIFLKKHLDSKNISNTFLIAALFIFNPFMLQNLAYRFDSLGMAIAIFLSVISYTYNNKNYASYINVVIRIAAGVVALSIYQPCANVFIGLAAIDLAIFSTQKNVNAKDSGKYIALKIVEFFVLYLLYILCIAKIWDKPSNRATIVSFDETGFNTVVETIKELYALVASFIHSPVYIYFIIPVAVILLGSLVKSILTQSFRLSSLLYILLAALAMVISLLGPNIILLEAPIYPRTLVSFSIIFVILAILLNAIHEKLDYIALIPIITVFAFSAQLGNALKDQREYENTIFDMIAKDLLHYSEINKIKIVGQVKLDKRAELLVKNKPVMKYFISPASEYIASFQLINKGFPQTTHGYSEERKNEKSLTEYINRDVKPIVSNSEYSIYVDNKVAIIKFWNNHKIKI